MLIKYFNLSEAMLETMFEIFEVGKIGKTP
jgi:hypothetical protein